eukprot:6817322-Alexandrium_andersonii.AAC.1
MPYADNQDYYSTVPPFDRYHYNERNSHDKRWGYPDRFVKGKVKGKSGGKGKVRARLRHLRARAGMGSTRK